MLLTLILLGVLGAPSAHAESPATPVDLIVEVVDDGYLPVPGVNVVIARDRGSRLTGSTDFDGRAAFQLQRGRNIYYRIRAKRDGFRSVDLHKVWFGTQEPHEVPARVQVRMHLQDTK